MEYSEDGKYFWDGNNWQPVDEPTEETPSVTGPSGPPHDSNPIQFDPPSVAGPSGSPDDSVTTSDTSNVTTHHFFENNDAIYMAISALFPMAMLFYHLPNFDSDEPYRMYEGKFLQIVFIISCFLMIGYGYALRTRSFARVEVILGTVAVPCLLWSVFAFGPLTYYMLLSLIAVGALALNIYVPKSRNFIPILSIVTMYFLVNQRNRSGWGEPNFVNELWNTYLGDWSKIGDFQEEFWNQFEILYPIFFFIALGPAFLFGKSVVFESSPSFFGQSSSQSSQSIQSDGYVTISEATQAVLPALGLILLSGGLGFAIILESQSLQGILIGSLIGMVGLTIAQFKLLADAINRGIRTSEK